jgi:hypothetical protein
MQLLKKCKKFPQWPDEEYNIFLMRGVVGRGGKRRGCVRGEGCGGGV